MPVIDAADRFALAYAKTNNPKRSIDQPKTPKAKAQGPRRGLRRVEAAEYVGVSPSKFDQLILSGRMPNPIKMDACSVWDVRALDEAFDALVENSSDVNPWDALVVRI